MSALFDLKDVCVRYSRAQVLGPVTLQLQQGEFAVIAGPNGAGKSTLLSVLAGLLAPSSGQCLFRGRALPLWKRRDFACQVAVVTQTGPPAFPFTVDQVVHMGRTPHAQRLFESEADRCAVDEAMEITATSQFRRRDFSTLSGGEKQRVILASALAQKPRALLLDEPSNHLDLKHQLSLHRLLKSLTRSGLLVAAVTHDLNLASAHADRIVLMDGGRIDAQGPPAAVLVPESVQRVFGVHAELHRGASGQPWLLYGE